MADLTVELPPGEPSKIDFDELTELTVKAAKKSLELLKGTPVGQRLYVIYRGTAKSIGGVWESLPDYQCQSVWDKIDKIWNNKEVIALMDYLWGHNAFKKKITGPSPDRSSWARFVFGDLIHMPLLTALERTAIENQTDEKAVSPWEISDSQLDNVIRDMIAVEKDSSIGTRFFKAICFLPGLSLPENGVTEFAQDIKVMKVPLRDRCIFLTGNNDLYSWDLFKAPFFHDHLLEIVILLPIDSTLPSKNIIGDKLDLLKWGLFTSSNSKTVPSEGPCLVLDRRGNVIFKFRRDVSDFHSSVALNEEQVGICRQLLKDFLESTKRSDGLQYALSHFGRSCLSNLNRDILLEAALGIDSLVSVRGGDSQYRFCLHGSAVLATIGDKSTFKDLKKLYDLRSTAAHGVTTEVASEKAFDARSKLAKIIRAVTRLVLDGKLADPTEGIAKAIEQYVIKHVSE